ncbi:MAG: chromosomal replication initiator protein DnaA, partial [Actinobacteria bacterium]|nr:chromosomal replication initiator protein DnaA [Actinomycetota bacterium]
MADSDLADVWARSLDGLADLQIQPHQRAWLRLTRPLGLVENTALIATPNEFVKEQLETRLRPLVTQALSQQLGRDIQLAVTVDPAPQLSATATVGDLATEPGGPRPATHPEPEHGARHVPPPQDPAGHEPALSETTLHEPARQDQAHHGS